MFWEEPITYFPSTKRSLHWKRHTQQSPIIARVFVAMVIFLPSCCLVATGDTYTETKTRGRELCCSNGVRCHDIHTVFRNDGSGIGKLIWGNSQLQRQQSDLIHQLLFFQIRRVG
jgi:hypothetical protein